MGTAPEELTVMAAKADALLFVVPAPVT